MTLMGRVENDGGEIAHALIIAEIEAEELERLAKFVVKVVDSE